MDAVVEQSLVTPAMLIEEAERNYGVLQRQLTGLTHADSLLQLPFRGNCLNWIIGHITQSRDKMLEISGAERIWTPEQVSRYERGSSPVTSGDDAMQFEAMVADLATAHQRLVARLSEIRPDEMQARAKEVIKNIPPWSVAEFLHFLLWHETYHVGQTEILRQLTGVNDKVI